MKYWKMLKRLHSDQRGAEGLEKLLIIAAVVLPLLALLIWFAKDIMEWVSERYEDIKGDAPDVNP